MQPVSVHRVVGDGPGVVCLGSTGAGALPWMPLAERLAAQWRVVLASVPDPAHRVQQGAPPDRALAEALESLRPAFDDAGPRVHLVGHSYGGALALLAALAWPERVESVAVYEPLLPLPDAEAARADPLAAFAERAAASVARGEVLTAARGFVDFFTQPGTFDRLPEQRRDEVAAAVGAIGRWRRALAHGLAPSADFTGLRAPVLHMAGLPGQAPARSIDDARGPVLPQAQVVRFHGLGHLGPLTHPDRVGAVIESFLATRRGARSSAASLLLGPDPSDGALIACWGLEGAPAEHGSPAGPGSAARGRLGGSAGWLPSSDPGALDEQPFRSPPV